VTLYVIKRKPPSHDEFKLWVQMGYLGSYDRYAATVKEDVGATVFMNGDLGPHCTECAAPSENLCDYPVGENRTCDRPLCDDHSHGVAHDVHYCRGHFIMWREYLASQRGYDVLDNVTPLGVVARPSATPSPSSPDQSSEGGQ